MPAEPPVVAAPAPPVAEEPAVPPEPPVVAAPAPPPVPPDVTAPPVAGVPLLPAEPPLVLAFELGSCPVHDNGANDSPESQIAVERWSVFIPTKLGESPCSCSATAADSG